MKLFDRINEKIRGIRTPNQSRMATTINKINAENASLLALYSPKIVFFSDPNLAANPSHIYKPTKELRINVLDPQSMIHEMGHYIDHQHEPPLSEREEFQWVVSNYIREYMNLNLSDWKFNNYAREKDEIFTRMFQLWYQEIDPRLNFIKLERDSVFYDESHMIAERLYHEMPEIRDYFYETLPHIYNQVYAELEQDGIAKLDRSQHL